MQCEQQVSFRHQLISIHDSLFYKFKLWDGNSAFDCECLLLQFWIQVDIIMKELTKSMRDPEMRPFNLTSSLQMEWSDKNLAQGMNYRLRPAFSKVLRWLENWQNIGDTRGPLSHEKNKQNSGLSSIFWLELCQLDKTPFNSWKIVIACDSPSSCLLYTSPSPRDA